MMFRYATAAVLVGMAFVPLASAAEKAKKPQGEWTHTVSDCTVTYKFEKNTLTVDFTKGDAESVRIDAAYGMTAEGLVFGVVTKVEKKGTDAGPEKGDLFSFEVKIDNDALTVSELNSSKPVSDEAKPLIMGQFRKKK